MKRTLSAAASVVVGGAGAIAFPAAASAAAPENPIDQLPVDHVANTAAHTGQAAHSAQQAIGDVVSAADPTAQGKAEDAQGKSGDELGTPLDAVGGLTGDGQDPVGQLAGSVDDATSKSLPTEELTNAVGTDLSNATAPVRDVLGQGQNLPADVSQRAEPAETPDAAQDGTDALPEQVQAEETDGSTAQQPEVGPLKDLTDPDSPLGPITGELPLDDPSPENVRQVSEPITSALPGADSSDEAEKSGPVTSEATGAVQDLVQEGPLKHAPLG